MGKKRKVTRKQRERLRRYVKKRGLPNWRHVRSMVITSYHVIEHDPRPGDIGYPAQMYLKRAQAEMAKRAHPTCGSSYQTKRQAIAAWRRRKKREREERWNAQAAIDQERLFKEAADKMISKY